MLQQWVYFCLEFLAWIVWSLACQRWKNLLKKSLYLLIFLHSKLLKANPLCFVTFSTCDIFHNGLRVKIFIDLKKYVYL